MFGSVPVKANKHGCDPKVSKGRSESPLVASAEAKPLRSEISCYNRKDQQFGRAHLARHSINSRKSSLGALLRKREVTGRDASLPAPFAGGFLWNGHPTSSWGVAPNPSRDAVPAPCKGQLPLDPSARLSWSRFHAPSACSFLALRLSPCLLSQLSVKNRKKSPRTYHDFVQRGT